MLEANKILLEYISHKKKLKCLKKLQLNNLCIKKVSTPHNKTINLYLYKQIESYLKYY